MAKESIRVEGLKGVLEMLRSLPAEAVSKNGGPVRSALRKGGKIMHSQMLANIQAIIDAPNAGGVDRSTGLLKKSLVMERRPASKGQKGEGIIIRVRRGRKYPTQARLGKHGPGAKEVPTAAQVGSLLEQGTERRRAYPWARPAFESKKGEVVAVFTRELPAALDRIAKRLARANGVKS